MMPEKENIILESSTVKTHNIFIAGGTGYIGKALIPELVNNNHSVSCLVREKSINKLPSGCKPAIGNALDKNSYEKNIFPADTFIHLVGVSHPGPTKTEQFRKIDFVSLQQSMEAAVNSGIKHFIYLSIAHPAPVMQEYIEVREECEVILIRSGLKVTILRPWYVLGPGYYWPYLLIPFYKILDKIPSTSEAAKRLGLVTLNQMIQALLSSVENPSNGIKIIEVPDILKNYSQRNKELIHLT